MMGESKTKDVKREASSLIMLRQPSTSVVIDRANTENIFTILIDNFILESISCIPATHKRINTTMENYCKIE